MIAYLIAMIGKLKKSISDNSNKVVHSEGAIDLKTYTGKSLIDECVTNGYKIYVCSAAGGSKLSDLPTTIAGTYVVYAQTYYKKLIFYGNDGIIHQYVYDTGWFTVSPDQ